MKARDLFENTDINKPNFIRNLERKLTDVLDTTVDVNKVEPASHGKSGYTALIVTDRGTGQVDFEYGQFVGGQIEDFAINDVRGNAVPSSVISSIDFKEVE